MRISESQARLFGIGQKKAPPAEGLGQLPRTPSKPRVKKRKEDLPENQVAKPIIDFLELKGWTVTRRQSGLFSRPHQPDARIRIGEVGALDWVCSRPVARVNIHEVVSIVAYFEIEMKGAKKEPSDDQRGYMRKCHARGITAVWFNNFNEFLLWYKRRFPGEVTQF